MPKSVSIIESLLILVRMEGETIVGHIRTLIKKKRKPKQMEEITENEFLF